MMNTYFCPSSLSYIPRRVQGDICLSGCFQDGRSFVAAIIQRGVVFRVKACGTEPHFQISFIASEGFSRCDNDCDNDAVVGAHEGVANAATSARCDDIFI